MKSNYLRGIFQVFYIQRSQGKPKVSKLIFWSDEQNTIEYKPQKNLTRFKDDNEESHLKVKVKESWKCPNLKYSNRFIKAKISEHKESKTHIQSEGKLKVSRLILCGLYSARIARFKDDTEESNSKINK